jgi:hypothetical protein
MTERQGVEIDYCPQCRGVWLDRGELDKIIERSTAAAAPAPQAAPPRPDSQRAGYRPPQRDYDDDDRYEDQYKRKKGKSFLGDLFDF